MTPRDYFGIIVRTVGLLLLVVSFYYLVPMFMMMSSFGGSFVYGSMVMPVMGGVLNILGSFYLLRGAPQLMDYCYPKPPGSKPLPAAPAPRAESGTGW